jgi:competence protein ComEC
VYVVSPPLAAPLLWAGAWASKGLLLCAKLFADLPGAAPPMPSLGPWSTLCFYAGLLLFALGRGRWRWGGGLAPLALALSLGTALWPRPGLSVTFLSVGHGDAVVLSSRGHHALVDGGGVPGGADPGKFVVVPFLREQGITELDLAVLSHPHPDHALGLATALAAVPASRLWLSAGSVDGPLSRQVMDAAAGARVEEVQVGHAPFPLGEAQVEVLGPPRDRALLEGVNDRSVVLRVRHGEVTFLLTGDLEEEGEGELGAGHATVLKAPHHGSRTSSTEDFVARVRPRFVVFCVGVDNRFGFPHPEVVDRYREVGARCLRTDRHGAVRFDSDGREVRVSTFLPGGAE